MNENADVIPFTEPGAEFDGGRSFEEPEEEEVTLQAGDGGDGSGDGSGGGTGGPDSGGTDSDDDDADDSIDSEYGADPDVGFDTPASIMAEANYGIDPYEGMTGAASTDPGPSGEAPGDPSPPAPEDLGSMSAPAAILNSILTAPPPVEMPMPENASARLARRRSARDQSRRRGRTSTILSSLDPLGGS